ncbi:uncharacterized protein YsxB (DUF464 family) [Oikeobacillus pervagus]|uniref:Ribosomal processing cysteine protease Prp n=1 Tax=Oikeobacillus pervagus TaxID=1325931 RepID=A0AAJ1WIL8_9BACI|nr:ribosomal-processing cysteine protease Prp [Oikeobacillus pervagus]MDQ0214563.1 uncharacterized protein YsxB (DUF464 family) [Oikeobacillus pervagus]
MIKVLIQKDSSGKIRSFTMDGHANFSKHGKDIVCAGASAVSFGTLNAIMSITKVEPIIEQGDDGGYIKCVFPNDLPESVEEQVQLLLEGMIVSLQTIERDYGKYIKITFQ